MTTEKTIWHSNVLELEKAKSQIPGHLMVLQSDMPTRLCKGFFVFDPAGKTEEEEGGEHHLAPMYDSSEECKEIEHESLESWDKAVSSFKLQPDTQIYPADDPKKLRIGFVVHPQREWHTVKISRLHDAKYDDILGSSEKRARFLHKF